MMIRLLSVFVLGATLSCAPTQSPPATAPSVAPVTAPSVAPATAPSAAPATAPSAAPATAPSTAATSQKTSVTNVEVEVIPAVHSGPCPVNVELVGTITTDGPGVAYYNFQAGAIGAGREGTIEFSAAGSKTVRSAGQAPFTPEVQQIRFAAGIEPDKYHQNAKWIDAPLNIQCSSP
ncbi:MAG: hypothetical protein QM784_27780 [Polyangiaceae bacterium]